MSIPTNTNPCRSLAQDGPAELTGKYLCGIVRAYGATDEGACAAEAAGDIIEVLVYRDGGDGEVSLAEGHGCTSWDLACRAIEGALSEGFERICVLEAGRCLHCIGSVTEAQALAEDIRSTLRPYPELLRISVLPGQDAAVGGDCPKTCAR